MVPCGQVRERDLSFLCLPLPLPRETILSRRVKLLGFDHPRAATEHAFCSSAQGGLRTEDVGMELGLGLVENTFGGRSSLELRLAEPWCGARFWVRAVWVWDWNNVCWV